MDFMAQQEQYLSRLLVCMLLLSCNSIHSKIQVPPVYVNISSINLEEREGITYTGGQPFSGIVYGLYGNMDTAFIYPYYKGKMQGETKEWYSNKQIREDRFYDEGRKTGTHKGWYS